MQQKRQEKAPFWSVLTQPWTPGPCKCKVNTVNQGHIVHQIFKEKGLMGCALEIGRVNKERGIVSFTWLIPLTSLFALSHSLSHAPCLILYFSHATYTSPSPPVPHASFALSSTLLALSAPSSAPLPLFLAALLSHLCPLFFSKAAAAQWLSEVSVSCRLKSSFSLSPSVLICQAVAQAGEFFLLVRIIASAGY